MSNLLHGRLAESKIYLNIRLHGKGRIEDRRYCQPVDLMDCDSGGVWHVIEPPLDDDGNPEVYEIRMYETGLGDMRDPILDHDGKIGHIVYRIGKKSRKYFNKKERKDKIGYELEVTDTWDIAQRSLPPTSSVQTNAPGGPPSGGPSNVTIPDGMHSAPTASNQGPISPAPAGAIPTPPAGEKAQQQAETGLCGCGREAIAVAVGPYLICKVCGRRVA